MPKPTKKPTSKKPAKAAAAILYSFDIPGTETADFKVLSVPLGEIRVYGVFNKLSNHVEVMTSQLVSAILAMQASQQAWNGVKEGTINGYHEPPPGNQAVNGQPFFPGIS